VSLPIAAFTPLTLSDYPAHVAAMVFLRGCSMRCHYCHNRELLCEGDTIPVDQVVLALTTLSGRIEGLVITGGEPCLHGELPVFCALVRGLGLKVKLDTNGAHPDLLTGLLAENLVNHVALDLKAAWASYDRVTGSRGLAPAVQASLAALRHHAVPYELRSTLSDADHDADDLADLRSQVQPGERWFLQPCRPTPGCSHNRPPAPQLIESCRDRARESGVVCAIRG